MGPALISELRGLRGTGRGRRQTGHESDTDKGQRSADASLIKSQLNCTIENTFSSPLKLQTEPENIDIFVILHLLSHGVDLN